MSYLLFDSEELKVVCDKEHSEDCFTTDLHKAIVFTSYSDVIKARKQVCNYPSAISGGATGFDHNLFNRLQSIEL